MYKKIDYYLEIDGRKDLYAVISDDDRFPVIYKEGRWELCGVNFNEIKINHHLKKMNYYDAAIYTLGSSPKDLYFNLGYEFYERKREVIIDSFKKFFDDFIEFASDDYFKCFHNRNHDLKYSAKELDEHYGTDYYETIFKYYDEYLKRKEEYIVMQITKEVNDFHIAFSPKILKK